MDRRIRQANFEGIHVTHAFMTISGIIDDILYNIASQTLVLTFILLAPLNDLNKMLLLSTCKNFNSIQKCPVCLIQSVFFIWFCLPMKIHTIIFGSIQVPTTIKVRVYTTPCFTLLYRQDYELNQVNQLIMTFIAIHNYLLWAPSMTCQNFITQTISDYFP